LTSKAPAVPRWTRSAMRRHSKASRPILNDSSAPSRLICPISLVG
jgi:hypothetical protein